MLTPDPQNSIKAETLRTELTESVKGFEEAGFRRNGVLIQYLETLESRLFGVLSPDDLAESAVKVAEEILRGFNSFEQRRFAGALQRAGRPELDLCFHVLPKIIEANTPELFGRSFVEALERMRDVEEIPLDDDMLREIVNFSSTQTADDFVGESGEISESLSLRLHLETLGMREQILGSTGDVHRGVSYAQYLSIAHEEGFDTVLEDLFESEWGSSERYTILWRQDGLLLVLESYESHSVNSAILYFNFEPNDVSRSGQIHDLTGSIIPWASLVIDGRADVRDGLRLKLRTLPQHGNFLPQWVHDPHLWLIHYGEARSEGGDYDEYSRDRISRLPGNIQQAIRPAPDTDYRTEREFYLSLCSELGFRVEGRAPLTFSGIHDSYTDELFLFRTHDGLVMASSFSPEEDGPSRIRESRLYFCVDKSGAEKLGAIAHRLEQMSDTHFIFSLPADVGLRYKVNRLQNSGALVPSWPIRLDTISSYPWKDSREFDDYEERSTVVATELFNARWPFHS